MVVEKSKYSGESCLERERMDLQNKKNLETNGRGAEHMKQAGQLREHSLPTVLFA